MASRTGVPGTTDPGEIWTSANVDSLPGGCLDYVEKTSDQTIEDADTGGVEEDLSGLSSTVTINPDRRIRITGSGTVAVDDPTGIMLAYGRIMEGATPLGHWCKVALLPPSGTPLAAGAEVKAEGSVVLTPTPGAHTYKMTLFADGGTDLLLKASATDAAWIMVEDVGPAS